jgi:hypothetical protein
MECRVCLFGISNAVSNGLDTHLPELMATLGETWNDLDTDYEKGKHRTNLRRMR